MIRFFITLVRRTASPLALASVALASALGAAHGDGASWMAGLFAAGLIALLVAAATPDGWLRTEGEWLGTVPAPRWRLLACAWIAVSVGAAVLVAVVTTVASLGGPQTAPMELKAVAGLDRSQVLLPGDALRQSLTALERTRGQAYTVRIHCTCTLGASAPVTMAALEAGGQTRRATIARRTWVEVPLDPAAESVRITNIGEGALAILGPQPIEVWGTSEALLGGYPRLWTHGALLLTTLVGLALFFGVLMGPGIAAVFAFALWLGGRMLADAVWPQLGARMPGGRTMTAALETARGGHIPLPPALGTFLMAAGCLVVTMLLGSLALVSWHQESRR